MKEIVVVGTGGFIGASLRYIASAWFSQCSQFGFPLGTLAVNFIGCALLGVFVGPGLGKTTLLPLRKFAVVSILGGFTTFSTFSLDVVLLFERGHWGIGALYAVGSMLLAILGLVVGLLFIRSIFT